MHCDFLKFTSTCPVTNRPDFYTIDIEYKSLKLYLRTFDSRSIFAERLVSEIAAHLDDVVAVPVSAALTQQASSGIVTTVTVAGARS